MAISLTRRETFLLLLVCLVCQAILVPALAAAHGEMKPGPLPSDVRGTYRVESGELVTFTGHYGMPSYELGGRRVFLRPTGDDKFAAWDDPDELLHIKRGADGHVVGLTILRAGLTALEAAKVELYAEHDVTFANGDVTLAGSVLLPPGPGIHPAVVIVHGAEAATRESYRLLASHFARRGVAALIYDKRGVGESGGSFRHATFDDLTGDAVAALQLLRALPEVDAAQVGMLGLSQGSWIIGLAAQRTGDVAFVIPVSASGFSPAVQDRWLNGNIIAHRELNDTVNRTSERAWRMLLSTRDLVDSGLMPPLPNIPGFWFHALDPNLDATALWEGVRQPVLGIWGELDCQVPAYDSLSRVKAALDRGSHTNYTLVVFPSADHSITLVGPCAQETTGWSVLRVDYPETYFPILADWVHDHRSVNPVHRVIQPEQVTRSELDWHQAPTVGTGALGSFLPQLGLVLGLLATFGALIAVSLGAAGLTLVRRRPVRLTMLGAVAVLGFIAVLLASAGLVELLLLGSPDGAPLMGGPLVLGVTPLFAVAMATVTTTLVTGAIAVVRARSRMSARMLVSVAALIGLAAWSSYWAMNPIGAVLV